MSEQVPAVVYGVKSSPDEKESVDDQHRLVLEAVEREGGRFLVAEPFGEANASGYRKERGPQLEAAMTAAVEAAEEHGEAELWVFHSSRLARGDGKKGRRSLLKIYADLLYGDVQIRSATDDEFLRNEILVSVASTQNNKYSEDLSAHVRRGKRQAAETGSNPNGPLPDGYAAEHWLDERGRKRRTIKLDQEREEVMTEMWALALRGTPDAALARSLNARGYRNRSGATWTRRAVQRRLTNPFYAGRVKLGGEVFEGQHPRYVEPADFDRLQAMRAERDYVEADRHEAGRPGKRHALRSLATCSCGRPMLSWASTYRRRDGSTKRTYRCPGYDVPGDRCWRRQYDAEPVEAAVLTNLDGLLPDFEEWIASLTRAQEGERGRLEAALDVAEAERDGQAERVEAVEAKWSDYIATGQDDKADAVLPMVERERQELQRREALVSATRHAVEAVPEAAPTDALLDFAGALRRALRGVDTSGSMAQVNAALGEVFEAFVIHPEHGGVPVAVEPVLRPSVAAAILFENAPSTGREALPIFVTGEAPALEWLSEPEPSGRSFTRAGS